MPLLILGYLVCYIDRSAISVAGLTMNESLGLTATQFGLGIGIFYLTYVALEVPSNVILYKVGARKWLARIMISWGLVTLAMAAIQGPGSLYLTRLLLGAAEAGFAPGILWYLTRWYPIKIRIGALTIFGAGTALAPLVGSPLGGLLLRLDGIFGLEGWRWLFIVEAIPAFIVGILFLSFLPDDPRRAAWLPRANRDWIVDQLSQESSAIEKRYSGRVRGAFTNPVVIILSLVFFLFAANSTGLTMWMPLVIQGTFGEPTTGQVTLLAAIPGLIGVLGMVVVSKSVKRFGHEMLHLSVILSTCGVLVALSVMAGPNPLGFVLLVVGAGAAFSVGPVIWQIAGRYITGVAAAAGFALINSVGGAAGFGIPYLIGAVKDATGSFSIPLYVVAAALFAASLVAQLLRFLPDPAARGVSHPDSAEMVQDRQA
ncbi:MFS transporter [Phytohabitans kaempferiae]|uniref:MFS transporter n=1 Tax=Phytohabitans kaempferiae TaxID=1620943 RepID=A0ABV6MGX4_9ACTN